MAPAEPGAGKTTVGTLPAVLRRRLANLLDRGVEVCSQEDQQWLCLILFAPADEIVPLPCQLVIRSGQILARAGRFAIDAMMNPTTAPRNSARRPKIGRAHV